jgi:putative heme-binding domain-containing protein
MRIAVAAVALCLFTGNVVADDPPSNRNRFKQDLAGSEEVEKFILSFEGKGAIGDDSAPTPAAESIKQFQLADGLAIDLIASEPVVAQPLYMSFDDRGRMWVVQYLQYPFPAGLKVVRYDQYLRAVFDKVPEPPPQGTPGADKITVFEDSDGDGVYDRHKDVITGLNIATSALTGRGGIWVLNTPYLLFYPDANGDDVPDGNPEVHLSGFGLEDTHSVANSLAWGPDGWLYGANGSTTTGRISSAASKNVAFMGQCIWRYHPVTKIFEVFAEGGGNTFSLDFDAKGRLFSGTNNGGTRGMFYGQGSYGVKNWAKHGPLTNPFAFGFFPHMRHEGDEVRFPQTFVINDGTSLPEAYRGRIISANALHNRVWASELSSDGSTYRTKDLPTPVTTPDKWFRPVDVKCGPDGAIYIADWYDTRLTHVDPRDNWHKTSGRIYRLRGANVGPGPTNVSKATDDELLSLLKHPNKWQRFTAVRLLGERATAATREKLVSMTKQNEDGALEALWALHWRGWLDESLARSLLDHPDEHIRRWSVRLIGDQLRAEAATVERLARLAREETYVQVRSQLASTAKRLSAHAAAAVVTGLLSHDEDADDPQLPLLIWWAIEAHCAHDRDAMLSLLDDKSAWTRPIVTNIILSRLMQRFALEAVLAGDDPARKAACYAACLRLFNAAPTTALRQTLAEGFLEAFAGRDLSDVPAELAKVLSESSRGSGENELLVGIRLGDEKAVAQALKVVSNEKSAAASRLQLIEALGTTPRPAAVPVLMKLLASPSIPIKRAALLSLNAYEDPGIGKEVCNRWHNSLPDERDLRSIALQLLASRAAWSKSLVKEVSESRIRSTEVPLDLIQQMRLHQDAELDRDLDRLWGKTRATSEEKRQQIDRLTRLVKQGTSPAGDAKQGRVLFQKHCATCHTLFGEGGQTGPNLTGYDREKLDFLAVAIVDPSAAIREEFTQFGIAMKDGRVLTGLIDQETPTTVIIRGANNQTTLLNRDDIEEKQAMRTSLMPDALLEKLNDAEVRDLFAFVMSKTPVK